MRVLVTGNMGYVGPVLAAHLGRSRPDVEIVGFDSGYFAHCLTGVEVLPELPLVRQEFGDIRDFPPELLDDVDAVVHLAAISNDPMGKSFEAVTEQINCTAGLRLAVLARDRGVRSFTFASSCSIYGAAEGPPRRESDAVTPLTAYARSKVAMEQGLERMDRGDMAVTCLRFATACGMSARLRLDLVLNDFVAGAMTAGEITVLSDGTPWRPLIDVNDMARAIEWATGRNAADGGAFLTVNAGSEEWNYQVKDLALAVQRAIPGTSISINRAAPPDRRSYRVNFDRFRELAPHHQPASTLERSIVDLKQGLETMRFDDDSFRQSELMRLRVLERHRSAGRLDADLRWIRTNG
jgi:nucleoside-diphosphate-sugar epimerase